MGVRIKLVSVGRVPNGFKSGVESILREFYARASTKYRVPIIVEVVVYGSTDLLLSSLVSEASSLGVSIISIYPVMHEAWRGLPRIHVNYEECSKLPESVLKAMLVHEAAHSVLHGDVRAYMLSLPFLSASESLLKAAYMASTAVKDYEVSRLLADIGYVDELRSYIQYYAGELAKASCDDPFSALEALKLLAPAVVLGEKPVVGEGCGWLLDEAPNLLAEAAAKEDLDSKVKIILDRIAARYA